MRRNWRGRYRNNWNRGRGSSTADKTSINNSSDSVQVPSTVGSSWAPANQLPIVVPIRNENNVWKLYFPIEGNQHTNL